jgi:hypothetical protein
LDALKDELVRISAKASNNQNIDGFIAFVEKSIDAGRNIYTLAD